MPNIPKGRGVIHWTKHPRPKYGGKYGNMHEIDERYTYKLVTFCEGLDSEQLIKAIPDVIMKKHGVFNHRIEFKITNGNPQVEICLPDVGNIVHNIMDDITRAAEPSLTYVPISRPYDFDWTAINQWVIDRVKKDVYPHRAWSYSGKRMEQCRIYFGFKENRDATLFRCKWN